MCLSPKRKNWIFANTPKGAKASAVTYSIVETAKENGLNPYQYLMYIFEKLPNVDASNENAIDGCGFLKPDFLLLSKMSRHIQIPVPPINILYFCCFNSSPTQGFRFYQITIINGIRCSWY
jgi:hypothetical protein